MKTKQFFRVALVIFIMLIAGCSKEDPPEKEIVYTKVCWTIIDDFTEEPIQDAKVLVSFNWEVNNEKTFESDINGIACYSFGNLIFIGYWTVRAEGYNNGQGYGKPQDAIRMVPLEE